MKNPARNGGAGIGLSGGQVDSTSSINKTTQRDRLLSALIAAKPCGISTLYAINRLNILCPASRVNELRKRGHEIEVTRINATDSKGHEFKRVAYYTLIKGGGE